MIGSALSIGWWSGWIRWSWSALISSAAVIAIAQPSRVKTSLKPGGRRARAAVVAIENRPSALTGPAVAVEPRPCATTTGERHDRPTPLEIVPLLTIEDREKFGVVEPVDLAVDPTAALDQAGIAAKVE